MHKKYGYGKGDSCILKYTASFIRGTCQKLVGFLRVRGGGGKNMDSYRDEPLTKNGRKVRHIRERALRNQRKKDEISLSAVVMTVVLGIAIFLFGTDKIASAEDAKVIPVNVGSIEAGIDIEHNEQLFPVEPVESPNENLSGWKFEGDMEVAAYCNCMLCVNSASHYRTYSGDEPVEGVTIAADLNIFHIGDHVKVGDAVYRVMDKVSSGRREKLSIYFSDHASALQFGRQRLPIYRIPYIGEKGPGIELGAFKITGYCSCDICCGDKEIKLTKTETVPCAKHTVAVDPEVIPLGSKLYIDGTIYVAEDTGKAVKGKIIDIFFDTHEEAVNFGKQEKNVYLLEGDT